MTDTELNDIASAVMIGLSSIPNTNGRLHSKTNQQGELEEVAVLYDSDPRSCPVRALQAWLATSDR